MKTILDRISFRGTAIQGVIDRRVLVNFRCDPTVVQRLLPAPFRPQLVRGHAMVGICLIRLKQVRPAAWPEWLGLRSENAAHRVAVEWDENTTRRTGVYVVRRDTDSDFNAFAGGRLFPGVQSRADFEVWEGAGRYKVAVRARDGGMTVRLVARVDEVGLRGSIFGTLSEASEFYSAGSLGWSSGSGGSDQGKLEGMELVTTDWKVTPLFVERIESSLFADRNLFPEGSVHFDNALLMREVRHEWRPRTWSLEPPSL